MAITSKQESFALWQAGIFGNKLRTWNTLQEVVSSGYAGTVSMRYKGSAGGGFCAYDVTQERIPAIQQEWQAKGAQLELITFNESAPDDKLTFQGELMRWPYTYCFFYSEEKKKMRDALKTAKHLQGECARWYLERGLTPSSYDDMMGLLELYPEHIIEFSAYEMCLGDCVGRNAVVWEVRRY